MSKVISVIFKNLKTSYNTKLGTINLKYSQTQ